MSTETTIVDWGLAERIAGTVAGGIGPIGSPPGSDGHYTPAWLERACSEAIDAAGAYAGLGPVRKPPRPELVGRAQWAANALATLAEAVRPLERRIAGDLNLPGPLGGLARRAVGAAGGTEAGVAAGYAARRVLGQYDVALLGDPRPARLLFVGQNMEAARRALDADAQLFGLWIALHEATHVIQFDRVTWLVPHLRELVGSLIEGATEDLDAGSLGRLARRMLREPRELVRATLRGELARVLASPEGRLALDRLQAVMSAIEGHAEHVMDACAAEIDPGLTELRNRLDQRRERRGGFGEIIARLLGMDLKLRQYELGKGFFDAVAHDAGPAGVRLVWRSPQDLPTLEELERPGEWLLRVGGAGVSVG